MKFKLSTQDGFNLRNYEGDIALILQAYTDLGFANFYVEIETEFRPMIFTLTHQPQRNRWMIVNKRLGIERAAINIGVVLQEIISKQNS